MFSQLQRELESDPILTVALGAAFVAFALTPLAFAVLARMNWFQARRGRVFQKPSFPAVVVGMLLVMGIPALFSLLALKSRTFDKDRYEFDPNRTLSVLDQGRQYSTLKAADDAVRQREKEVSDKEQALLNAIKKFDDAFLALRDKAAQNPTTYQPLPGVLDRLADIHKAVGLDAPQQLMNLTAPPAAIATTGPTAPQVIVMAGPNGAGAIAAAPAAAPSGGGLAQADADSEINTMPEAQRAIAGQLPLSDVPSGWVLDKQGDKHIETFTADNLYEKIDGRAESFLPFSVQGMAYCSYHLASDEGQEVQLYIYDMHDPLNAFGKYASEKPEEAQPVVIGKEGYSAAGSILFYTGRYYDQIVSATEDAKAAAFALEIAKKVAAKQSPTTTASGSPEAGGTTPDDLFKLLPKEPGRSGEKYLAKDAFGYSFLSDVFGADYKQEKVTWQGFVRPYSNPEEAQAAFKKYGETVKSFGGQVKTIECPDCDGMIGSSLDGLYDVIFVKGNALAGSNGSTAAGPIEPFTKQFAKDLPKTVPTITPTPGAGTAAQGPAEGDQ